MEIVQISKGRLKVVLDASDLRDFSIDVDKMDYDSPEAQKAFEGILAVVRAKTDLETDEGKTYVQLYPSRDGGCELFLIHISVGDEQEGRALIPFKEQVGYLCVFDGREEARFFKRLLAARGISERDLFYDRSKDRYLFYTPCRKEYLLFMEEFGVRIDPSVKDFLGEHFSRIKTF